MIEPFDRLHELPDEFFSIDTTEIRRLFPNPVLVHLDGEDPRQLFVSILLHGNEYTGLKVMQQLLLHYPDGLPRTILLFIGNVRAAEANRRFLPDQVDFNRCWPGSPHEDSPTARMMQRVFDIARALPLFAAVDVHNNTGRNPHYACITDPSPVNCNLAARFNRVGMVFNHPGVSTRAFNGVCPAVTIECGLPGDPDGIRHAIRFIDELLHLDELPVDMPDRDELHLVESHLSVQIPETIDYAFDLHAETDLRFQPDFEDRNFTLFDPHEPFAYTRVDRPLRVLDAEDRDLTDEYLRVEEGTVFLNHIMMPAMITRDRMVIRQDCLCHLMQDYLPGHD